MLKRYEDEIQGIGRVLSMNSTLQNEEAFSRSMLGGFATLDEYDEIIPKAKELDYFKILDLEMIIFYKLPPKEPPL